MTCTLSSSSMTCRKYKEVSMYVLLLHTHSGLEHLINSYQCNNKAHLHPVMQTSADPDEFCPQRDLFAEVWNGFYHAELQMQPKSQAGLLFHAVDAFGVREDITVSDRQETCATTWSVIHSIGMIEKEIWDIDMCIGNISGFARIHCVKSYCITYLLIPAYMWGSLIPLDELIEVPSCISRMRKARQREFHFC